MNAPESTDSWQPTTAQISIAPERAILATLDTTLLLAARVLRAEHTTLGDTTNEEPYPPHLALAESILILAVSLRELIAGYHAATDHLLGDG